MSFFDWLIIGGTALLIKNEMKKAAADREEAEKEFNRYMADLKAQESEWNRTRAVNSKRCDMPCFSMTGYRLRHLKKWQNVLAG